MSDPDGVNRDRNRIESLAEWIKDRIEGVEIENTEEIRNALNEIQYLASPGDGPVTYVKLLGVNPEDIPYQVDGDDEAEQLANHIYDYIHEDLSFDVSGVATHVNPDNHVIEVPVEPNGDE